MCEVQPTVFLISFCAAHVAEPALVWRDVCMKFKVKKIGCRLQK